MNIFLFYGSRKKKMLDRYWGKMHHSGSGIVNHVPFNYWYWKKIERYPAPTKQIGKNNQTLKFLEMFSCCSLENTLNAYVKSKSISSLNPTLSGHHGSNPLSLRMSVSAPLRHTASGKSFLGQTQHSHERWHGCGTLPTWGADSSSTHRAIYAPGD